VRFVQHGRVDELQEKIIKSYFDLKRDNDFIVVEGYNLYEYGEEFGYDLNMNIAKTIGSPVVLVSDGQPEEETGQRAPTDRQTKSIVMQLLNERVRLLKDHHVDLLGIIFNRFSGGQKALDSLRSPFESSTGVPILGAIPVDRHLLSLEMRDMVQSLKARILLGGEKLGNSIIEDDVRIYSEQVPTVHRRIQNSARIAFEKNKSKLARLLWKDMHAKEDQRMNRQEAFKCLATFDSKLKAEACETLFKLLDADADGYITAADLDTPDTSFLVITGKDRLDIILALILFNSTSDFSGIYGGIILAGKGDTAEIESALAMLKDSPFLAERALSLPILDTNLESYEIIDRLDNLPRRLRGNSTKVERSIQLFDANVRADKLLEGVRKAAEQVSVKMFTHNVYQRARQSVRRIVLPDTDDDRILQAAGEITKQGLADIILLGPSDRISKQMRAIGLQSERINIVDPSTYGKLDQYVSEYCKISGSEDTDKTRDFVIDPFWFGTVMVQQRDADALVGGVRQSTFATVQPAMKLLAEEGSTISSIFFMYLEKGVLAYADCALNAHPNAEELSEICKHAAQAADTLGISPRIAMLSYATGDSNKGPEIEKIIAATQKARAKRPDLPIFGPTQYDAAVDPVVAKTKVKGENFGVAGRANVLIFPDLNTGNNTYKAVQQSTKASAIGPLILGLKHPISDLSRGATVNDVVHTIAVTAALC